MKKIVCVHTGAGASIFGTIENEIKSRISVDCQISHITNPGIIAEVSDANGVTEHAASDLLNMYTTAVNSGADIILNMCSSVGEVADAARPVLTLAGTKIIRVDHGMCREAAEKYERIGVVATLESTLAPSCRLVEKCAAEKKKEIQVQRILASGAFGLGGDDLKNHLVRAIEPFADKVDVLVFAQASTCFCAEAVEEHFHKPVLTSPGYAAAEVAEEANS